MSSSILSSKTSFDFELALQLTVVFLFTIQIAHAHKLLLRGNLHYIWLHASFSEKFWSLLSRQEPDSFVRIDPRDVTLKLLQAATHTAIYNNLHLLSCLLRGFGLSETRYQVIRVSITWRINLHIFFWHFWFNYLIIYFAGFWGFGVLGL